MHIFQTEPDSIRPIFKFTSESRVQFEEVFESENEELKRIRDLNTEFTVAVIPRQGSELVTASFNPEEAFGVRLFDKKTCKCVDQNIFPIREMPEIFDPSQIAQLKKNRQEF